MTNINIYNIILKKANAYLGQLVRLEAEVGGELVLLRVDFDEHQSANVCAGLCDVQCVYRHKVHYSERIQITRQHVQVTLYATYYISHIAS